MDETIAVGEGAARRRIAVRRRAGAAPGLFWLGGFRSDMTGAKAGAVDAYAAAAGLAATRFDYSGHGASGGRFEDGTISAWLEESAAVFATTTGPQIVLGSSMGGWLALLLARLPAVAARVAALVLVAPAPDFTERLLLPALDATRRAALDRDGAVDLAPPGGPSFTLTRALIEDGRRHLLLDGAIPLAAPTYILHGGADTTVPTRHVLALVDRLAGGDVTLSLTPDGDHRLSRPADLDRLAATLDRVRAEVAVASP